MIYPRFLKKNDTIGITAISGGTGNDIKEVKTSLNHLKEDYKLIITPNVYGDGLVSSSIETRIKEFNDLLNEDINALFNLRGGDFAYEVLDKLDYQKIVDNRLLVEGASDTSSICYILTTKYDYATLYGFNAKSYDSDILTKDRLDNLDYLKGNLIDQISYPEFNTTSVNGEFKSNGIIIGGCLDLLRFVFGTSYDGAKEFVNKYKDKKIIWYFDVVSMSSMDIYLTLLQMKNMGYFKYTDTVIFGKIWFPKIECDLDYIDAYKKVFGDINIVIDTNISHLDPKFTIINGSLATIKYKNKELRIKQELMYEDNG